MLTKKSFVKVTKGGHVRKEVREHYLRDDIYSGTPLDPDCPPDAYKLSADAKYYLVVDTNIVLHQMDFLEHSAVDDVIVMSVVLQEAKAKNTSAYQRLRALTSAKDRRFFVFSNENHKETFIKTRAGETPNDRNDRAIRHAAAWYKRRLPPSPELLFLTNDADNRKKAAAEGLTAMTTVAYARLRPDAPELADLTSAAASDETFTARGAKRQRIYEDHLPEADISAGIKRGTLHQGALRVNRYNFQEAYVDNERLDAEVLISGRTAMNRGMDGDVVAIEILPQEQWRGPSSKLPAAQQPGDEGSDDEAQRLGDGIDTIQIAAGDPLEDRGTSGRTPCGRVVGIIRRNWRTRGYAGSLQPPRQGQAVRRGAANSSLFCPVERKYPMIRITTRQADVLMDKRLVVVIDVWDADSAYPSGHYVRTLGTIGDRDAETEVIILEHDINTAPFTPAVHACVPPLPWSVQPSDLAGPHREDLRHLAICSVDPPGCKDIDDALHIRPLPNGHSELGVHIADVTAFLHPGTAMDDEAASRATTTYLVQRRIDMLPKPLTEDICSLRGDVERLAFSVLWEMDEHANAVSVRFTKSVIKSRAAMTYQEAQSRIDDARLDDEISVGLRAMNRLTRILRQRRQEAGALTLASPEVRFQIDEETNNPTDVGMYQIREANQMVEEMMLLANVTVAEAILRAFPSCSLLRRHPTPTERQFDPLLRAAAATGASIEVSSSKALADSLDQAVRPHDSYYNTLIRILATRCMTQAVYFGSHDHTPPQYVHYGLAAPLYTHFTSPIRRYADVIVHRLLGAALALSVLPATIKDPQALRSLADNLNNRHRNAQFAGRASVELYTLMYFKDRTILADARITKVRANGLIIFIPKYGIEGTVHLNPKDREGPSEAPRSNGAASEAAGSFLLDEEKQTVASPDGSLAYTVFDKVAVKVSIHEGVGHRRSLVLELIPREQLPASELMDKGIGAIRRVGSGDDELTS